MLTALLGLALLAGACSSDDDGDEDAAAIEPLGDGVVTVPDWFDDPGVLGVLRADADPRHLEPGRALADGSPVLALRPEDGADDPDRWITVSVAGLSCIDCLQGVATTSAGRPAAFAPAYAHLGVRCGSRGLHVDLGDGVLLVVASPRAEDADLQRVADALTVEEGDIAGVPPSGWEEVGRLGPAWRRPPQATVATFSDGMQVRVRRVTPTEATAISAMICPDPLDDADPPTSVEPSVYAGQEPRAITTPIGEARVGVLTAGELAVVAGDRLVLVRIAYVPAFPSDIVISRLVGGVEAVPEAEFDAAAGALDQRLGDESVAASRAAGAAVLADPTVLGRRMVVVTASTGTEPALCAYLARSADGFRHGPLLPHGGACLADRGVPAELVVAPGTDGLASFHLLADLPPDVVAVTVTDRAGGVVEAAVSEIAPGRRVAVAVVPSVSVRGVTLPAAPGPDFVEGSPFGAVAVDPVVSLFGGPVTVRGLDAGGAAVAEVVVGGG